MNAFKSFIKNTLTLLASVGLILLLMEIGLRFLPVNEGLRTQPVSDDAPILHFEKNRTFTWSEFPDFAMANTVRSNNFGFINDQDYQQTSPLPLIAVIGDSYVEATMVPYPETFHGRLAHALDGKMRVYSFGASGAPLSQYLAYAKYARDTFQPTRMIFTIIANDFDESLLKYKQSPGMHYFRQEADGSLSTTLIPYQPGAARTALRHSRLALYLALNLRAGYTLTHLFAEQPNQPSVGQTAATAAPERIRDSKRAIDTFFEQLPAATGLDSDDIMFVVDAIRPNIYSAQGRAAAKGSYARQMFDYFLSEADSRQYQTIDLTGPFIEDYRANGLPFEFPKDGHWNSHGHAVVADTILTALSE